MRPQGRTYCTAAVVFSAGWDTVTCDDGIVRKSITETTTGNTVGWHELIANKTGTCFAIASNSSHTLFGSWSMLASRKPRRRPLRWSDVWLQVVTVGGPRSGSKSST
jgi:hypothetical protein